MVMNSRQRVEAALDHRQPDRVPLDLGATYVSGMQVSSVYLLRQALGLDPPGTPVKVVESYQMLGEIAPDLLDELGVDTQRTLPCGAPDDVRREVRERIEVFGPGGGFVFNPVHNVRAGAPSENLVALYETVAEFR